MLSSELAYRICDRSYPNHTPNGLRWPLQVGPVEGTTADDWANVILQSTINKFKHKIIVRKIFRWFFIKKVVEIFSKIKNNLRVES